MALSAEQYKAYLQGLAKEKGFDEARTGKLVALIEGDGELTLTRAEIKELLQPIVEHPLARQGDYSRALDSVSAKEKTLNTWYEKTALPAYQQMKTVADQASERIKKYEERYGAIDETEDIGGGKGRTATGEIVDMTKVDKLVNDARMSTAREMLTFQLDADKIREEHFSRFKELPSLAKLMEVVAKEAEAGKQITLGDAYNTVYGERVQKANAEAEDKRIEDKVNERLKAEKARRTAAPTGAAVAETGDFFAHHAASQKADAKPASDAELESQFAADLETELAKINQSAAQ